MSGTGSSAGLGNIPIWGSASSATDIANTMMTNVTEYSSALTALADGLFPQVINVQFPQITDLPKIVEVSLPELQEVTWSTPAQPGSFTQSINITPYIPGTFNQLPPTLNFGTQPAQFNGVVPTSPTLDFNYVYPVLDLEIPPIPTLLSLDTVVFNPLNIPTFTQLGPQMTMTQPSPLNYVEGTFYTSTLLSQVQDDLLDAMTEDSDIGLSAGTQQAMWDAAYEREYRAQADALAALDRDIDTLGYQLPPGVYTDARFKIYTETHNTTAGLSRDIMVKQAELRLENVTKAREIAVNLESKLIDYTNQIAQRAFDRAKYITEAQISIYNAQVQVFAQQIEGYKATIESYNAQLKGIEIYVEQLKAQISFEQTKAEINTQLVTQYKTEIDAQLAQVEIAKLQVDIIQTRANVQKIKVDAYAAQIQGFVGQVNAYTAQVEGYKANIEAQGAIENVYKTQVDAYAAEVNAGVGIADAFVKQYEGEVRAYEAQLEGYKSALQAMVEQARAAAEYNTSLVEAYKGDVQATESYNNAHIQRWEAVLNEQEKIAEVAVKEAEANGQLYIAAKQLSIDASKTAAQVAAQLGAAALNAVSFHNSSQWTLSEGITTAVYDSTATNTNTNYNSTV
jgi:hypothetical protein